MKSLSLLSVASLIGAAVATPTKTNKQPASKRASLPRITPSGNAFYKDGERFFIRGIDYQPGGNSKGADPLADKSVCDRDIKHFKDLGVNTVRVYIVDNSKNHDYCMGALADAGIYLVVDVNNSKYSIRRDKPHDSYNTDYLQNVFATVEEFSKYDNTLAFFSGNEVVNKLGTEDAMPYVKATTRDIKNYMNAQGLRKVPVGYSAADVAENRMQTAHYMNCGSEDALSDFFAFNDYSWCNVEFADTDWNIKVKNLTGYGLPIFLSEYGCNENGARKFDELSALMSNKMDSVYSGGLMYEYSFDKDNKFGIVDIKGDSVEPRQPEYNNFKKALSKYEAPTGSGGAASKTNTQKCPPSSANWKIDTDKIPTIPKEAEKFMKEGAGKGPGLDGPGSMDAKDSGTSTDTTASGKPSANTGDGDDEENAAGALRPSLGMLPFASTGVALLCTMAGAFLL